MADYTEPGYGNRIAEIYDEYYAAVDPASIDLLAKIVGDGTALELGIGTGRIALPLHERGVKVKGIDASLAMLSKLKEKPLGPQVEVMKGSFADFEWKEQFQLIYVVFNTFFNLQTQEDQIQCFKACRRHLADGGKFLIEAFVPDPCRFTDHQTVRVIDSTADPVRLEASLYDPVNHKVSSQHILISQDGIRFQPVRIRFAWPSELDLMARIAGLSLENRWGSWRKAVFDKHAQKHISVYGVQSGTH